jgi:hypothetical protein
MYKKVVRYPVSHDCVEVYHHVNDSQSQRHFHCGEPIRALLCKSATHKPNLNNSLELKCRQWSNGQIVVTSLVFCALT